MTYIDAFDAILPYMTTISGEQFAPQLSMLRKSAEITDILLKCPQELGFVCSTNDYIDYILTYSGVDSAMIALTQDEYKTLKDFFGDAE